MRNRIIIALLILVIGFLLLSYLSMTSGTHKATNLEQPIKQMKTQDPIKNTKKLKVNQKTKGNTKKKINALQIPEDIALELSQQKYSSEPLLEVATISLLLDDCKKRSSFNFIRRQKSSELLEEMILNYQDKCQDFIYDYPILSNLGTKNELDMIILNIAMQSDYADFFQKGMAVQYLSDEEKQNFLTDAIKLIITSKSASLIVKIGELPLSAESQPYFNQLFKNLGTISPIYTRLILTQASVLFSCQYNEGMTCSPISTYMLKQCFENENACGLDVQTWFQTNNTPAHNRDIAKLIDFFESQILQ